MSALVITFWLNLLETSNGSEWRPDSWDLVFKRLEQPKPYRGDNEHPGWSAVRFEGQQRSLKAVREVFALCLDYDEGETPKAVKQRLAGFFGVMHTTRKHTAEAPRFRVVLPLSRPVTAAEYSQLWVRFADFAGSIDESPKDPSRFWYLPGSKVDGPFESWRLTGELLDVDEWLARPEPKPAPPPVVREHRPTTDDEAHRLKRASAYLKRIDPAIAGQGGDVQTWNAALHMVKGFDLGERLGFQLLWSEYNPRCQPPWSEGRIRYKCEQAARSNTPAGYLLDSGEERFRPAPVQLPPPPADAGSEDDEVERLERAAIQSEHEMPSKRPAVERYAISTMHDMVKEVFEDANRKDIAKGFTTGIQEIDSMIGGLRRGHVTLLAAQTSWGKSTFASMVQDENYLRGVKVLTISREDKRLMFGRRIVCKRLSLNAMLLRDRELSPKDVARIGEMANKSRQQYIFWDAIGVDVETVAKGIEELCAEYGFELVIGDYIQRFRSSKRHNSRRDEVGYVGEVLSDSIKKANAAGLLLSQCKRTAGREPTMDDVKESGDLENIAEHVMIGWREAVGEESDENNVRRNINVPKNKDGPVMFGWHELPFNRATASFIPDVKLPPEATEKNEDEWSGDDYAPPFGEQF